MPKYKKSTERAKAQDLTKLYIEGRLNQSEVARQKGITRQAINQQLQRKPVQDILQIFFDSEKLDRKLIKVAEEGLNATTRVNKRLVKDHAARYRFWNGLMTAKGKIKQNGKEAGIKMLNIIYGYRDKPKVSLSRAKEKSTGNQKRTL